MNETASDWLEQIWGLPDMPQIILEANKRWEEEQARRAAFYGWLTPDVKAEFINGEVIVHSPATYQHNATVSRIFLVLGFYCQLHDLGYVGTEKLMIRLTRNDYEPDLCFFPKDVADGFVSGQSLFPAPALAVEVLSASTKQRDRGVKFEDYAHHGIEEYWIVDADEQTVGQHLLHGQTYHSQILSSSAVLKSAAIDGLVVPTQAFFDDPANAAFIRSLNPSKTHVSSIR